MMEKSAGSKLGKISSNKDVNRVAKEALHRGWSVEVGGKHNKLRAPDGILFVSVPSSPSCPYAHRQFERDITRIEKQIKLENEHVPK